MSSVSMHGSCHVAGLIVLLCVCSILRKINGTKEGFIAFVANAYPVI